jgi:hypothetical protein
VIGKRRANSIMALKDKKSFLKEVGYMVAVLNLVNQKDEIALATGTSPYMSPQRRRMNRR